MPLPINIIQPRNADRKTDPAAICGGVDYADRRPVFREPDCHITIANDWPAVPGEASKAGIPSSTAAGSASATAGRAAGMIRATASAAWQVLIARICSTSPESAQPVSVNALFDTCRMVGASTPAGWVQEASGIRQ